MSNRTHLIYYFTILFVLWGQSLLAQELVPRPGLEEETARTFSLVLASPGTKEIFYKDRTGEYRMLPPGRNRNAIKHNYVGPSPIVFYEKVPGAEGLLIERPLIEVEFKSSLRDMLIILHPLDNEWTRARSLVLDDSLDAFSAGSVYLLNASLYPIVFEVNAERASLEPSQSQVLEIDTTRGILTWRIAAKMEGDWQLVRASSTQFLAGMRQIIVVNVDVSHPSTPTLDIFSLYDRPQMQ